MLVADEKKGTKKTEKQLHFDKTELYHYFTSMVSPGSISGQNPRSPCDCVFSSRSTKTKTGWPEECI